MIQPSRCRTLLHALFSGALILGLASLHPTHADAAPARPDLQRVAGTPLVGDAADDVEARCDFNGDGLNDLITCDRSDGGKNIRIRLGIGAGKFAATTTDFPFSPSEPTSLAVGALTGDDARPDIAVAVAGTVRVISNAAGTGGAPQLSLATTLSAAGVTIKELEVADLNGDGRSDIVATGEGLSSLNFIEGKVVVFLNTAAGFGTGTTLQSPGSSAGRLALGDIDVNGNMDIVVVNPTENSLAVYMATGSGAFNASPVKKTLDFEDLPSGVALGQLEGDAQLEVVVWRESPLSGEQNKYLSGYTWLTHSGNGALILQGGLGVSSHAYSAYTGDVVIADINSDGQNDVIFTNPSANSAVVNALILNGNEIDIFNSPVFHYALSNSPKRLSISNLNGDTATVGGATLPKLDLVAVVQPVNGDKCVDVFLNGAGGGGGGGGNILPEGKLTAVASQAGWSFTARFPSALPAGVTVKVQYSPTPEDPNSWLDVFNGIMSPNAPHTVFTLSTGNVPPGNFAFRAIAMPSVGSTLVASTSLPTKLFTSKVDTSIAEVTNVAKLKIGKLKGKGLLGSPSNIDKITKRLDGDHGEFVWYALKTENTGDSTDRFTISGPASGNGFLISYFEPDTSDETDLDDITADVTTDQYKRLIAPHGVVTVYVRIRVSATLPVDTLRGFDFTARSTTTVTTSDLSRAEIEVTKPNNVFYVITTADNGSNGSPTPGSLREAVGKAILNVRNKSTIKFELPATNGFTVIPISTELPPILLATRMVFDGNSQAEYQQAIIGNIPSRPIEVRGPANGTGIGLNIQTSGCLVQNMVFSHFNVGLQITGINALGQEINATGNVITGCEFEGNWEAGVLIKEGAFGNIIGGIGAKGNIFTSAYNASTGLRGTYGVSITGQGTIKNKIQGNVIGSSSDLASRTGTDVSQGFAIAGVSVRDGAGGNTIGGRRSKGFLNEGNCIMGNFGGLAAGQVGRGVELIGAGTNANFVQGNNFGRTLAGSLRYNKGDNVVMDFGATDNLIGGIDLWTEQGFNGPDGVGNFIQNAGNAGVSIRSTNNTSCQRNRVEGNLIGGGTNEEGNNNAGVVMSSKSTLNVVGGKVRGAGNVIQANGGGTPDGGGVVLLGSESNFIQGNFIGVNAKGTVFGNTRGIYLLQAHKNTIGSNAPLGRNVISGNFEEGILIDESNINVIFGNYIGVKPDGATGAGNAKAGVQLQDGSSDNEIGGIGHGFGNLIHFNGDNGVRVTGNSVRNSIRGNNHGNNSQHIPIDLVGGIEDNVGYTTPDPLDGDTGANDLQNPAEITGIQRVGGQTKITATFNSTPRTDSVIPKFAFDVHADGAFVGTVTFQSDGGGNPVNVGPGDPIGSGSLTITVPQNLTGKHVTLFVTYIATQGAQTDSRSTSESSNSAIIP